MTAKTTTRPPGKTHAPLALVIGIATEMRTLLAGVPALRYVHRRLPAAGLEIVLERRTGDCLRLALARTDRAPSVEELTTLAGAFGAPDDGAWQGARRTTNGRTLYICETTWREQ